MDDVQTRVREVRLSSVYPDGTPMYPGLWVQFWVKPAGWRTWVLMKMGRLEDLA